MTWFPIEQVRGEHLRTEHEPPTLAWAPDHVELAEAIETSGVSASTASAMMLDETAVWRVSADDATVMIDATSGELITPLSEDWARRLAQSNYRGDGAIGTATFFDDPPREYGRPGPAWRVDFDRPDAASFYVDASTGDVRAVRTGLWRTFDFMWGLHIMDWSSRENFNSWWIKMTASLAVLFALAGVGLVVLRLASFAKAHR